MQLCSDKTDNIHKVVVICGLSEVVLKGMLTGLFYLWSLDRTGTTTVNI